MNIVESIRAAGVVGAGGAGFPAHVKLNGKADCQYDSVNDYRCQPNRVRRNVDVGAGPSASRLRYQALRL